MRVLHVISSLPKAAGTSVFCAEVCGHLQSLGVDCCIVVQKKKADDYPLGPDVSVIEMKDDFSGLPFLPDLVHIHALWVPFLHKFAVWARRRNIPLVYSPHGMLTPWALGQKRLKKWTALALYQYWDLRSAKFIHVTADSEFADVRRLGLNQPVVVAPLGVKVPSETPPVRHNNPKIALFVSRIHPKKGLLNLVDAWAILKKQSVCENWQCVLAGPDEEGHSDQVMAHAKAVGVADDFKCLGPVFGLEKNQLYSKADIFVLPTYSENFGVVVIEALAHGCPVITTKGAPWTELLGNSDSSKQGGRQDGMLRSEVREQRSGDSHNDSINKLAASGRCGWWIEIGVESLAVALEEAMRLSDEARSQMGANGRRLVESKYTWPAVAKQMKVVYESCVTQGAHG